MQIKKTIAPRELVEKKIDSTINNQDVIVYDWMYELNLSPTQRDVFANIFHVLKRDCMREHYIDAKEMAKKIGISKTQFNLISRELANAMLIHRRCIGHKMYYSLYLNVINYEQSFS